MVQSNTLEFLVMDFERELHLFSQAQVWSFLLVLFWVFGQYRQTLKVLNTFKNACVCLSVSLGLILQLAA